MQIEATRRERRAADPIHEIRRSSRAASRTPRPPATTSVSIAPREAQAAHDLAIQGHLLRLWALPGAGRTLGLYQARDAAQMEAILASLPLTPWMTVDTTPLSPHPSDPAIIHPPTTAPAGTP